MLNLLGKLWFTGAVVVPLVSASVSAIGRRGRDRRCRTATALGWFGAVLALAAALWVALRGPFTVVLVTGGGRPLVGLWANQLTVTLLTLVCVVGAVVQSFSLRYLQGDRTAPRFFAAANVVVAAMAVVCTSATVAVLVVAWVSAGMGFVMVVGARPDLPGVRTATRRTLRMFAAGDLALVAALAVMCLRVGNIDLASPLALRSAAEHLGSTTTLVAALVAVAALTRSAQGPLGRWLPGTVAAPTPASALLHAGVVNGGGILLVRLAGLTGGSVLVMVGVFSVAGVTAAAAAVQMVHKQDVKGSLVYSTIGQMGFMVTECAVGAYLAAVVHLIGHAFYKATLFFGTGSQVPRAGQHPRGSEGTIPSPLRALAAGATTVATLAAMAAVPGVLTTRAAGVLLVFVAATVASAAWSWWGRGSVSARWAALWTAGLVVAGTLYGLALAVVGSWIAPALPPAGADTLSPWWLAGVAGGGLVTVGLAHLPSARRRAVAVLVNAGAPPLGLPARGEGEAGRAMLPGMPGSIRELVGLWEESAA